MAEDRDWSAAAFFVEALAFDLEVLRGALAAPVVFAALAGARGAFRPGV